ncbi:MAG: hypothetical protein GC154_01315 [bacterium]|nr:hypothetical protein [bacterium]
MQQLRSIVKDKGCIEAQFDVDYDVWYSTLQGNYPYNSRLRGEIAGIPVRLRFTCVVVPNTFGSFPVSSRIEGFIGDDPVQGRFSHRMVYSAIAGNVPVNDGVYINHADKSYRLSLKTSKTPGTIRLKSEGGGKVHAAVFYKKGKMVQPDEVASGGKGGPRYESGIPIFTELNGKIEDISLSFKFIPTYYTNTSSGRSPVNRRAKGFLQYSPA